MTFRALIGFGLVSVLLAACGAGSSSAPTSALPSGLTSTPTSASSPTSATASALTPTPAPIQQPSSRASRSSAAPAAAPERWWGVTVDDVSRAGEIATSLRALPRRTIVRVVFDKGQSPDDYRDAVDTLRPAADLFGAPVDSSDAKDYTVAQYADRFRSYVRAFGSNVAVWEIGNEVNGEWTGDRAASAEKVGQAFDIVRAAGGHTALTLYYNPGCYTDPANEMLPWARAWVPERVKAGVDEVLVSYYEADCNGHQPSHDEWVQVFGGLRGIFPAARLGFGEVGAAKDADPAAKAAYLTRYYTMPAPIPGFIGGFFWWYYAEDALPYQQSKVWAALRAAMASSGN